MGFDAVSFSAGIGAGQESANRGKEALQHEQARHQGELLAKDTLLRDEQKHSGDIVGASAGIAMAAVGLMTKNRALEKDINQRWIPYAVTLRASLVARKVEREVLVDALKRLDPANVAAIEKKADEAADASYNEFKINPEKISEINFF